MTWEAWVTCGVVALVLWCLARGLAGSDVILVGAALVLVTLGLTSTRFPTISDLVASFGNEGVLTVAVLYVVAAGLTETGGMRLLTERLLGRPRGIAAAQLRMSVPAAVISAFINNTPVVAMFIPVVTDWCKKTGLSPSKLFIPLSYATILGGMCTLIGTSTNLVVHGLMVNAQKTDAGMPLMGMFTLTPVGISCALAGVLFILIGSRWLLPARTALRDEIGDARQYTVEMWVAPGSPVDGLTIESAGLRQLPGAYLSAIERDGEVLVAVGPEQVLHGDDRLVFVGVLESVIDLQRIRGLLPATDQVTKLTASPFDRQLVEAVVSEANPLVGKSIRTGRFRSHYDAVVIAVYPNGERLGGKLTDTCADVMIRLSSGYGPWAALAAVYVMTVVFTELVTNNAAAALAFPIAVATAHALDVNFMPFAIAVAIGASAGFATPLGYQTHLMVYGPGGYHFSDFARIGLPLDILCGIVTVTVTPLVYPF